VLLDPIVGRVLYDDVINDATMTVQTQISVSASATTVTTVTPTAGATTSTSSATSAAPTLPAGISGSDQSCSL
jgi:hypothetical protein